MRIGREQGLAAAARRGQLVTTIPTLRPVSADRLGEEWRQERRSRALVANGVCYPYTHPED